MEERGGHMAQRWLKRGPGPWLVSLLLHAALVLVVGALTSVDLSLAGSDDDDADLPLPPVIHATMSSLRFDPETTSVTNDAPAPPPDTAPVELPEPPSEPELDQLLEQLRNADAAILHESAASPADLLSDTTGLIDLESLEADNIASFGSVQTTNARRIAFVIDGSGSMIPYLQNVLAELDRALGSLTEDQFYAVIFFQGNEAVVAPPRDRLTLATVRNTASTIEWVQEAIVPRGRSNPVAALRHAIGLRPDVIFLMSENITGAGEFEIPHDELLALLDAMNPVVDGGSGRRRVRINCIQFLEPTEAGTLRTIAEQHGGIEGYAEMSRQQLGLER